jgi:hypothetical protein
MHRVVDEIARPIDGVSSEKLSNRAASFALILILIVILI